MFLLFPLFVQHLGGGEATIGLLLGAGMVASVGARPFVGLALDRLAPRTVLLAASVVNVLSFLPFLAVDALGPWLAVWATLHFVAWGALFGAYFAYAAGLVPAERRAEGIAVFGVPGMLSNGLGPALGEEILARGGYDALFLAAAALAALSLGLVALVPAVGTPAARGSAGTARALGALVLRGGLGRVVAVLTLFGVVVDVTYFYLAPFTRTVGVARAAPYFLAYSATSVVLRIGGRRLLDRLGPHRVAIPALAAIAASQAAICLVPAPGALVVAGMAGGVGHGSLFPVMMALALARAPVALHGSVASLVTAAVDLGALVGTPAAGLIAELAGYRPAFALMAVVALAGLVLVARDPRRPGRRLAPSAARG